MSGKLPFPAADPAGIIHAHAATKPTPPTALHSTLPAPLSNIILKLLAKEPQDRYQSAEGLLTDLERCEQQWQNQQNIAPFPLGEQDISPRLLLPEKVYGRQPELSQLHTALTAPMSKGQLWLVTGDLGMGKTTLITALREPARQGGIGWLSYRAEATAPGAPYAAALGVLKDFTQQVLAQEPLQRASWQERLTAALAGNVTQLLRHIPELGLLLPAPPDLPDGGASDTHFMLTAALQVCLKTITTASSSLLIFIDEAHQADADSLRML